MITAADFYGGSEAITTLAVENVMHPRRAFAYNVVQVPLIPAGRRLYTPDVATAPWRWKPREGRAMFAVSRLATAANSVTIRRSSDSTTITTVAPGKYCELWLVDAATDSWAFIKRDLNTVRTASLPAGLPSVSTAEGHATYTPFCFEGSLCEYLYRQGNEPLDGEGVLDLVVAPMYQDPTEASNATREAVRAADIVMPKLVALQFSQGCFTEDANHPWNGSYALSDQFWEALEGSPSSSIGGSAAKIHSLEYDSTLSFPTTGVAKTSNPYHLRRQGSGVNTWIHTTDALGQINCHRYVWRVLVPYGPEEEPDRYTLELRFVLEHTMDAPCELDSQGGGVGTTNNYGGHGSVCMVFVFTDELNPAFVENSTTFQPADFAAAYTWDRDDPIACGIAYGFTESVEDKGVHPQCAMAAAVAMTWHAPVGQNWYPLVDHTTVPGSGKNGRNFQDAYVVRNGNPWTNFGSCAEDAPLKYTTPGDTTGRLYNCLFGYDASGSFLGKAITLGGGLPTSKILEWLCWENGTGVGRTFLKPSKPGWLENCGSLDVSSGNCASIGICTSDGDNSREGDNGVWPRFEVSPCDGHPDEPFEGVGGSHGCFKSGAGTTARGSMDAGAGTHCCIKAKGTTALFRQPCVRSTTVFGDSDGAGGCNIDKVSCSVAGIFSTHFALPVDNYDFQANGNQLLRELLWSHYTQDPDHPLRSYTYDSGAVSTLNADMGAFTLGASEITNTGGSGANPVRSLLRHEDNSAGSWAWYGVHLTGNFLRTLSNGHGAGFLYEKTLNAAWGYGIHVSPVDVDSVLVELSQFNGTTETVLHSQQLDGVSTDGEFSFRQQGTDIVCSYTPVSGPAYSKTVSVWMQDLEDGLLRGVLYSKDTSGWNAGWSDVTWEDIVPDLERGVWGRVRAEEITCVCDNDKLLSGYGKCTDTWPTNCGLDSNCNCTQNSESKTEILSTAHSPSPFADIDDKRTKSGECGRQDLPCPFGGSYWTANTPTYHGGPSPARCACKGRAGSGLVYGCDVCEAYARDQRYIAFPLPLSQECYRANLLTGSEKNPRVDCLNEIPLMCRGIDEWAWAVLA